MLNVTSVIRKSEHYGFHLYEDQTKNYDGKSMRYKYRIKVSHLSNHFSYTTSVINIGC